MYAGFWLCLFIIKLYSQKDIFKNICAFPPFAILGKVLQKVMSAKSTGLVIAPNWPTQPCYSLLLKLLIDFY